MDNQMNNSEQNNTEYHVPDEAYNFKDNTSPIDHLENAERVVQPNSFLPKSSGLDSMKDIVSKIDFVRFKPLFMVIGLVVAIFVVYIILSLRATKDQSMDVGAAQEMKSNRIQPAQVSRPQSAMVLNTAAVSHSDIIVDKMNQNVDVINRDTQQNSVQLKHLSDALTDQQVTLGNLNKTLSDLALAMNELSKNVDKVVVNTAKPVVKVTHKKKIVIKNTVYHVKSIVAGRAWLESDSGILRTVRVGDALNGGRVEAILPRQGMVLMSSGEVIQFGANDI